MIQSSYNGQLVTNSLALVKRKFIYTNLMFLLCFRLLTVLIGSRWECLSLKLIFWTNYGKISYIMNKLREVILCFALTPPAFYPPSTGERKKLVSILKKFGLTLTTSRIHLLHHLTQTQIPLTAFELSRLVNIPLSTTHRNLSTFADFGLVDFIVDRSSVCRWYLLTAGCASYCPVCNQSFNAAY